MSCSIAAALAIIEDPYKLNTEREPCETGAVLLAPEQCQAAFNALQPSLPPSPPAKWNSCCDPADNLPYGCTLRTRDNDFIYNSNTNSTETYV